MVESVVRSITAPITEDRWLDESTNAMRAKHVEMFERLQNLAFEQRDTCFKLCTLKCTSIYFAPAFERR